MKLPASVQEIANVIGRDQALLLIGALPRVHQESRKQAVVVLYVPTAQRLGLDHRLVQILGYVDALKLCKVFGGEILYPANCAFLQRDFLHQTILRMMSGGDMKATEVAAIVGVHERTVRNLIREKPPEESMVANNDNRQTRQMATA